MNSGIVRPPTLTALVAESIREAVFRGMLRQGERLQEVELSKTYNVSRGTVREALRLLQDEGMVQVVPHRGALVDTLTPRTIQETYSLRILLECHAVELALAKRNYTKQTIEVLENLLRQMDLLRKTGDSYQLIRVDSEFHTSLCAPCDHLMLMKALGIPKTRTRLCIATLVLGGSAIPGDPRRHHAILKAVADGDAALARQALTAHLQQSMEDLLVVMQEQEDHPGPKTLHGAATPPGARQGNRSRSPIEV